MQGDDSVDKYPPDPEESREVSLYDSRNDVEFSRTIPISQLDMSTDNVPEALRRHLAQQLQNNQSHFISITVPEHPEPLVFNGESVITIGRRDDHMGVKPSVDLSDLKGVQLGVSRRHAEISAHNGQFFIKDLQSANGTWVNDLRLVSGQYYHLRSGDQLRFGRIICTITLHKTMDESQHVMEGSADIRLHRLTLKAKNTLLESAPAPDGIHIDVLNAINTYLQSVTRAQNILRAVNGKPEYPVTVRTVNYERDDETLVLDLYTSAQIIEIIKTDLPIATTKIKTETSDLEAGEITAGLAALILENHPLDAEQRAVFMRQLAATFTQLLNSPFEPVD